MTAKDHGDPRLNPLRAEMAKIYEEVHGVPYVHTYGKDGMALKRLLAQASPEEIKAVWVRGLRAEKDFDRVYNFAELSGKYTRLAAPAPKNPHVYQQQQKRPEGVCARCGGAPFGTTWGHILCGKCWGDWSREVPELSSNAPFDNFEAVMDADCKRYEEWTQQWAAKGAT